MRPLKKAKLPEPINPKGTLSDYYAKLGKMGLKIVGQGWFSYVFGNDEYVIKVARNDPAYDLFLEYALAHQDNPYMPKIYDVQRYKNVKWDENDGTTSTYTVVKMERLKKNRSRARAYEFELQGRARAWPHQGWKRKKGKTRSEDRAYGILATLFRQTGSEDLHKNNIMMRGKQVVIIDPISDGAT